MNRKGAKFHEICCPIARFLRFVAKKLFSLETTKPRNHETTKDTKKREKARQSRRMANERYKRMRFLIKWLSFFIRAHPRLSVAKDFAALPAL